jgi:hypothetical protein
VTAAAACHPQREDSGWRDEDRVNQSGQAEQATGPDVGCHAGARASQQPQRRQVERHEQRGEEQLAVEQDQRAVDRGDQASQDAPAWGKRRSCEQDERGAVDGAEDRERPT